MALHLNLLHEEILEQRQRQRDPLKIGMYAMFVAGALMFGYYMWNAYATLEIKSRLGVVQRDWAKVEPRVTTAQKRSSELNEIVNTTKALDTITNDRFFWAPFLAKLSRCVAPNAQLINLEGLVDETKGVSVSIEGLAAGREPRAAAEEIRQLLLEQVGQDQKDVKVEFKTLEDLDTMVNVGGANMATARFILTVDFNPFAAKATPPPAKIRSSKREAKQAD
jgi:hypothetical protein